MVSKVFRSWPQSIYNLKLSIELHMLKHMSTNKEQNNISRGRNQNKLLRKAISIGQN